MKKFLIVNLFLLLIFTSILSTVNAATITDDSLSNNITKLNSILANKIDTTNPNYLTEIVDENGNVPAYEYYPSHLGSRSIKTLKAYDGKIFMGLGDWTDNTGPVKVIYYDTTDGKVKTSGTIADEAVETFTIIDNELYTVGTDPRANWGYGSFYVYDKAENKWIQHQNDKGWVHPFRLTEFHGKIFISGETTSSPHSHIQYTTDKGVTYHDTLMYHGDTDITCWVNLRCYNLYVCNDKLYAYCRQFQGAATYNGIYEYDEATNRFNYVAKLPSTSYSKYGVYSLSSSNYRFDKSLTFNNKFLYVSSGLYTTTDFKTSTRIDTKTKDVVQDILVVDDTLYTLSYAYNSDKTFTTRIYGTKDLENFKLVYEFTSETPPFCFEYYDNSFYVGTALGESINCKDSSKNGSLYRINLDNAKRSLSLNQDNKVISITDNGESYSVNYDLSAEKSVFKTTLTFNNTMTEKEWEQEYSKIRNLNLVFATVANSEDVDLDSSTSYYNNVLSENTTDSTEKYTSATAYAKAMFAKELNITDDLFTITTTKVSETDDEYKTEVTLTINNEGDYSSLKPAENNNNTNNSNNNSQVEDYISNNIKLPQTGKFFEFKNLIQLVLIASVLLVIFFSITDKKAKKIK